MARLVLSPLWIFLLVTPSFADGPRFTAVLSDGRRVTGDEVRPWHATGARPRLSGADLFDPANPVVWVKDGTLAEARLPVAFVEFVGGDVLPGQVVAHSSGDETLDDRTLPFFLVEPEVAVDPPGRAPRSGLRVIARWLRRVVWERRQRSTYEPGTLFFRDGRNLRFRSVRWGRGEVRLLLEEGISRVSFDQIAELHLARVDPWEAYFEELAVLSPDTSSRLMRLETIDGLRVTSSIERFRATSHGSSSDPKNWIHVVQPAWSLDSIWLRHRSIRTRLYYSADRLPLSVVEPVRTKREAILGSSWGWRKDRCVQGGALESGGSAYAWGFGVHARCELEFELHPCVQRFRARVGLDRVVGAGGCARAEVALRRDASEIVGVEELENGAAGQAFEDRRLWQSEILVGSSRVEDTGALDLQGASDRGERLLLVVDPLADDRPPGADPFDIRDSVDWLEPILELDTSMVRAAVVERMSSVLPVLDGWTVRRPDGKPVVFRNRWDESGREHAAFRLQLVTDPQGVEIFRRASFPKGRRWLFVAASRLPGVTGGAHIELARAGEDPERFKVPGRDGNAESPAAMISAVRPRGDDDVSVRLRVVGSQANVEVDLRALVFSDHLPGLREVFEDRISSLSTLGDVEGVALLDWREPHSGVACVRISSPGSLRVDFAHRPIAIREHPAYGEFRYLRVAWKKSGGGRVGISIGHGGRWGPPERRTKPSFRLDQGSGSPLLGSARRLSTSVVERWEVHDVDLVRLFGEFPLTGIELHSPDGGLASFDRIWLARTREDWRRLDELSLLGSSTWEEARASGKKRVFTLEDESIESAVAVVAPGFSAHGILADADDRIEEAVLLDEHRGRSGVLRTHPRSRAEPAALRRRVKLSMDPSPRLFLSVAHHFRGDWRLVVRVDGEEVASWDVGPQTSADGWLDRSVDLSRYAGREIDLEVANEASGWAYEYAYWWNVRVRGAD
jgi:hypothetical protein